eukprot:980810_1
MPTQRPSITPTAAPGQTRSLAREATVCPSHVQTLSPQTAITTTAIKPETMIKDTVSKHTKQFKPQTAVYLTHLMQYLEKADSKTVEGCDALIVKDNHQYWRT